MSNNHLVEEYIYTVKLHSKLAGLIQLQLDKVGVDFVLPLPQQHKNKNPNLASAILCFEVV